jgi:hypothetical protein
LPGEDSVLIRCPLARGGQTPGADKSIAAKNAENDVRVADVDDEEVRHGVRVTFYPQISAD